MLRSHYDFDELEFIRARLNVLASHRRLGRLTPAEVVEYRDLCLRELTLINDSAPPHEPHEPRRRRL